MSAPIAKTAAILTATSPITKRSEAPLVAANTPKPNDYYTNQTEVSREQLEAYIDQINHRVKAHGIEFEISDSTHKVITRVIDSESGETIRQFPSEALLHVAEELEALAGFLVRETA